MGRLSIKTKLSIGIIVLLFVLFTVTAVLLVFEKRNELARDIYTNARSYSELTSTKIIDLYKNLLAEKSFFVFNREIRDVFKKNSDITAIDVYSYGGEILYDSEQEKERVYEGEPRFLDDEQLAARIKAQLPSYLLSSGRVVYLKKTSDSEYLYVDRDEGRVEPIADTDRIVDIVMPLAGTNAVRYGVSYENLQSRVIHMTQRIVLLLVFGVLVGLGFAVYFSRRITKPIEKLTAGALVLGKGDFSARVEVISQDEVGVLSETFNKMAGDLQISTKAMIERERLGKELELAMKIQKQILPKKLPDIPDLEIATFLLPAAEIGGDCYDFIQVESKDNTGAHFFYIGDVTGHGVPSGLVVSIANALIYSYVDRADTKEILTNTNRVLKMKTSQNMFMTLLMLKYENEKLSYVSAGHPEMLHYYAKDETVITEKGGGIALGMVPDLGKLINEVEIPFSSGDCVVLYSDGIPEAVSEKGEMYGIPRFKRALQDVAEIANVEAIKNALVADVKLFMGKAEQMDDITLVVIRKK
ncbi:SpoIIE family protein phosphatase [Candidatus Gracilibacteria bacterium]|nr:SpoIIE family protein phosphatase [Candidatus Gracilibacteria bacterium]